MTRPTLRNAHSALLTLGAVLGVVCVLSVAASLLLGIRPLVVQSGSMSPTIETGALAWAKQVPAADLEVGDVVMVHTADGDRVTHRIVAIDRTTDTTRLTLQGDANSVPDSQAYPVDDAYRVFADIPYGGRVVAFLSGPIGLFVMGMYAMGMLLLIFRRRQDDDEPPEPSDAPTDHEKPVGKRRCAHRRTGAVAMSAAALLVAGIASPSWAAFTDGVPITGTSLSTGSLTTPTLNCVRNSASQVTISWTAAPSPAAHGYTAAIVESPSPSLTVNTSGASRNVVLTTAALSAFNGQTFTVRVTGNLPGTNWVSGNATQQVTIAAGGANIDCGTVAAHPLPVTCSVVGTTSNWRIKLDWTYGPPDPATKFVVRSTPTPTGVPGTPADVAKNLRTWTSTAGMTNRSGQIWVVAVEGTTEIESARINYNFGLGGGSANKLCPSP